MLSKSPGNKPWGNSFSTEISGEVSEICFLFLICTRVLVFCDLLISLLNKVHKFQFPTSRILLFTHVQKLYRPDISKYLLCMLQCLDNLWRLFILFWIHRGNRFTLRWTFWKGATVNARPSEKFLFVDYPKQDHNEQEFES